MAYKGTFAVTGRRKSKSEFVYDVDILPNGASPSAAEHYNNLSKRDLLRQARRHRGYLPRFYGPKQHGVENEVTRVM